MNRTLYEKYGGFATLSRAVLAFYNRVLDSDRIGDYFEDVDMERLIDHQPKFLSSILGGPASYGRDQIRQIHRPLELGDEDFDEMTVLLRETLEEFEFGPADIDTVMGVIESHRRNMVAPPNAG